MCLSALLRVSYSKSEVFYKILRGRVGDSRAKMQGNSVLIVPTVQGKCRGINIWMLKLRAGLRTEIRRKIRRKNATHAKAKTSTGSAKIRAKFETLRREIKADIRKLDQPLSWKILLLLRKELQNF